MWKHFSTCHILLHICLYVIDFLHISHMEKLLHMKICHMEKFLHMTDFSPQPPVVVLVTNIRYEDSIQLHQEN